MNALIGFGATLLAPKLMSSVTDQKVQVLHASPGRLRLQCGKWKNEPTARNLESVFAGVPDCCQCKGVTDHRELIT